MPASTERRQESTIGSRTSSGSPSSLADGRARRRTAPTRSAAPGPAASAPFRRRWPATTWSSSSSCSGQRRRIDCDWSPLPEESRGYRAAPAGTNAAYSQHVVNLDRPAAPGRHPSHDTGRASAGPGHARRRAPARRSTTNLVQVRPRASVAPGAPRAAGRCRRRRAARPARERARGRTRRPGRGASRSRRPDAREDARRAPPSRRAAAAAARPAITGAGSGNGRYATSKRSSNRPPGPTGRLGRRPAVPGIGDRAGTRGRTRTRSARSTSSSLRVDGDRLALRRRAEVRARRPRGRASTAGHRRPPPPGGRDGAQRVARGRDRDSATSPRSRPPSGRRDARRDRSRRPGRRAKRNANGRR